MNILAIDTATDIMSVALQAGDKVFEGTYTMGLKHSENLMPLIDLLTKRAGIEPGAFDLVVCSKGPGSFTGLRIGISTAKGIAFGCGCPVVSIPTMDAMVYGTGYFNGLVVPVIDARKKRIYTALYSREKCISEYYDVSVEKLLTYIEEKGDVLLTGPDGDMVYSLVADKDHFYLDKKRRHGIALNLIEMGLEKFRNDEIDYENSSPIYIRKSEAEIARFGE